MVRLDESLRLEEEVPVALAVVDTVTDTRLLMLVDSKTDVMLRDAELELMADGITKAEHVVSIAPVLELHELIDELMGATLNITLCEDAEETEADELRVLLKPEVTITETTVPVALRNVGD